MLVVHGSKHVPAGARRGVVAIGNFDGVHRGHLELLRLVIANGRELGAPAGVMVFEPHPRAFFAPGEPHFRLTSHEVKLRLLEKAGLDFAVVMAFDAAFSGLSAESFIADILVRDLSVRHVIVGYDFFFGSKRRGTPDMLKEAGMNQGFGVTIVAPVAQDGEVFSSSAVRLHLAQGDVTGAAGVLGRPWRIAGPVVGGAHRGAGLGFPTANVPMPKGTALAHGIYAVRAYVGDKCLDGAAYLGTRPTFDDGMPVLEVFLFDFDGDLYGREMEVEFIGFVRDDRKFASSEALTAQMEKDVARAREILARR